MHFKDEKEAAVLIMSVDLLDVSYENLVAQKFLYEEWKVEKIQSNMTHSFFFCLGSCKVKPDLRGEIMWVES